MSSAVRSPAAAAAASVVVAMAAAWASPPRAAGQTAAPRGRAGGQDIAAVAEAIGRIVALGDEQVDYARVELELAALFDKAVHVGDSLAEVDRMARALRRRLMPTRTSPLAAQTKVGAMANYVFEVERIGAAAVHTPAAPTLLHELLRDRRGTDHALAILYLALARRVGMPLKLVPSHGHVFVRYESDGQTYDIELTAKGRITPAGHQRKKLRQPDARCYLQPLPPSQAVALILARMGDWLRMRGRYREALLCLEASLRRRPGQPEALVTRGTCLSAIGRHAEGLKCAEQAIRLYAPYSRAWTNRAACLANVGRRAESLASYAKAIELDPNCPGARVGRGMATFDMGKPRQALVDYYHVLRKIDNRHAPAWLHASRALERLGDHRRALICARQATDAEPRNPLNWLWHGYAACEAGRLDEARRCARRLGAMGAAPLEKRLRAKIARPASRPATR